ncbi:MAG: sigma-54-dependent Fis family transcriptional regulator [Planctomycetes bacterium]|nr:sigma-54-dependent Fis family transcriptional regulator [Planctomycetota bacterium]
MQRRDRHDPLCGDGPAQDPIRGHRLASLGSVTDGLEAITAKILICTPATGNDKLKTIFEQNACTALVATDLPHLLRTLKSEDIDVVVLEYPLAGGKAQEAVQAIQNIKDCAPATEVVIYHSAHVNISLADYCQLIIAGTRSFINEQACTSAAELARRIRDCATIKRRKKQREIQLAQHDIPGNFGIVGNSPAMRKVFNHVQKAARLSDAPVLITGASGTGKQLLAQAIHDLDEKRRDHPFIAVNCSAITTTLAESELFGHKQGAFTGATGDRLGYFRAANQGTIFLDEISELNLTLQPKLLRVLQESRVMPVGDEKEHQIDVRIIAATNQDLSQCIAGGQFRLDLHQRLNVIPILVPPLSARKDDILPLIRHFVSKHASHYRGTIDAIDPRVVDAIAALDCEGNVRQLENLVRHILLTKEAGNTLELSDLPRNVIRTLLDKPDLATGDNIADHLLEKVTREGLSLQEILDYCEQIVLEKVLAQSGHNQTKTAQMLKTTPRTIFNKIKKHHVD